jgi:hypothetical protein
MKSWVQFAPEGRLSANRTTSFPLQPSLRDSIGYLVSLISTFSTGFHLYWQRPPFLAGNWGLSMLSTHFFNRIVDLPPALPYANA